MKASIKILFPNADMQLLKLQIWLAELVPFCSSRELCSCIARRALRLSLPTEAKFYEMCKKVEVQKVTRLHFGRSGCQLQNIQMLFGGKNCDHFFVKSTRTWILNLSDRIEVRCGNFFTRWPRLISFVVTCSQGPQHLAEIVASWGGKPEPNRVEQLPCDHSI